MSGWKLIFLSRVRQQQSASPSRRSSEMERLARGVKFQVENLEDRLTPAFSAIGAGPGGQPIVTVFNEANQVVTTFLAYEPTFSGGVSVAMGDVNADGVDDIVTGSGVGGGPHVKVFDGRTFEEILSFFAYEPEFTGGVSVATTEIGGDGHEDIITGTGTGGGPHVKVFDGKTQEVLHSFFAFDPTFTGGVNVASGDLNGDLLPDIIVGAGASGGPHIKAFDGATAEELLSFYAYIPDFFGGVNVASGDVDGNGTTELITGAGPGGGPHVRAWTANGTEMPTMVSDFMALGGSDTGGVLVGSSPGQRGAPDWIATSRQTSVSPLELNDIGGQVVATNEVETEGTGGFSVSSVASQPDLLIRYHTLSQIAPDGGAGRIEVVGEGQYRIVVAGVTADTILHWFADAPGRGTGVNTLSEFVNQIWPRQYGAQGATAVLQAFAGEELYGRLFHLSNLNWNLADGTLAFDANLLGGDELPGPFLAMDRLILGISPSDNTAAGTPIPAVGREDVRNYAVAAVGGVLTGEGRTGQITFELPFEQTAHFGGLPTSERFIESISDFVAFFGSRFGDVTPNAGLMYHDETGALKTVTVNLTSAEIVDGKIVFDVTFSGAFTPGVMSMPMLFIDHQTTVNPTEMPTQTAKSLSELMYTDAKIVGLKKELTLTNRSDRAVYPYIRGVNDGYFQDNKSWAYDTKDDHNKEYRAYIGYTVKVGNADKFYFGLQPGMSITINVPLAFWDGARIGVATDPTYLKTTKKVGDVDDRNPFQYYDREANGALTGRYIERSSTMVRGTNGSKFDKNGKPVVLYYFSETAKAPVEEAPMQLLEYTIRDPYQRTLNPNLPSTDAPPHKGYLGPLFNYDVSFVDSLMLPVVLEAPEVPVAGSKTNKPPFGWVGAPQTYEQFQQAIKDFTSSDPAKHGLGTYFGGLGWNQFFLPDPKAMGVKIPATKNIFEFSPLLHVLSAFSTNTGGFTQYHKLASGGAWFQWDAGGTGKNDLGSDMIVGVTPEKLDGLTKGMVALNAMFPPGTRILEIKKSNPQFNNQSTIRVSNVSIGKLKNAEAFAFVGSKYSGNAGTVTGTTLKLDNPAVLNYLKPDMIVTASPAGLPANTRIQSIDVVAGTITLSQAAGSSGKQTFVFQGQISDYITEKLYGVWYGWADYYVDYIKSKNPYVGSLDGGSIQALGRKLTFASTANFDKLYPGMIVTGPGIPNDPANNIFTTITKVDTANKTLILSKISDTAKSGSYSFALPRSILRSTEAVAGKLDFSGSTAEELAKANQFAEVLYLVMDAFSTIPKEKSTNSDSGVLLQNIIGGNVTKIPNVGAKNSPIWRELTVYYRDASKSLERGVYDFREVTENTGEWYPNPGLATPGVKFNGQPANFNIYNLDPYVWFVHVKLGVSGYAFSLDDDAADVSAVNSIKLQVNVGGLQGLPNQAEWSLGSPYGVLVTSGKPNVATNKITGLPKDILDKLVSPTTANGELGAIVLGKGVVPGTRVLLVDYDDRVMGVLLDTPLDPNAGSAVGTYTFSGPVHFTGTIDPKNAANKSKITNIDKTTMDTLNKITQGGKLIPGALTIIGPGIDESAGVIRLTAIDVAARTVTLEHPLESTAVAGTYRFKIT